jgi:hypothetical protein
MLLELAELADQKPDPARPVLELLFDDILTRTSIQDDGETTLLAITAFLPRSERRLHEETAMQMALDPASTCLLWDADEGRYVLLAQVPAINLPDDRSLMDAILDTFEKAQALLDEPELAAA